MKGVLNKVNPIDNALSIIMQDHNRICEAIRRQLAVWNGDTSAPLPLLMNANPPDANIKGLNGYDMKAIHNDSEKMFESELIGALSAVSGGADAVPSLRANMGCSVYPSLLGVLPILFEDKMPWVKEHLTKAQLSRLTPEDIVITEEFASGLNHMAYMKKRLADSPARLYPLDLQGPFDTAHIVYGDEIFYDMFDDPSFVHHLLDLSCHAIILGMEKVLEYIPESEYLIAHYNGLVMPRTLGGLKISEDTSTLLSPDAIDNFVVPYTNRILEHFGGGYIHYCGKNDYLLEAMLQLDKAHCINFGNPEKHNMDETLAQIVRAGKLYYGVVNQKPGETDKAYFTRVREASQDKLLLMYSASDRDTSQILHDWEDI